MSIEVCFNRQSLPPGTLSTTSSNFLRNSSFCPLSNLWGIHIDNFLHHLFDSQLQICDPVRQSSCTQHYSQTLPWKWPLLHFFSYLHHSRKDWIDPRCQKPYFPSTWSTTHAIHLPSHLSQFLLITVIIPTFKVLILTSTLLLFLLSLCLQTCLLFLSLWLVAAEFPQAPSWPTAPEAVVVPH